VGIASEAVASYSNSGVTLVAPGGDPTNPTNSDNDFLHWVEGYSTTTAAYPGDQCTNGVYLGDTMCRALFAGTSQATPQVSGTIALMMAYHGGGIRSLSPATVTTLLTSTADNIGQPSARQGAGRLNVGNAVAAAHP
jgi:subtilisin family serine protease